MTADRQTLFHFAPIRLGPGSQIEPGNWGRLIGRYEAEDLDAPGGWRLARELIFEEQRPRNKPSRLCACFALPTHEDALAYRALNDRNCTDVLHEVEIIDPTLPTHIASLSWIDHEAGPFLDPMRERAKKYWAGLAGIPEKGSELLTASAFRVVKCLE
jgi:hypothetical protein